MAQNPPFLSWNPIALLKNFFYRTNQQQQTSAITSPLTDFTPPQICWPVAAQLFDEFVNTYPHYNLDPWESDFGLLAAYQKLRDNHGVLNSGIMGSYIGMMPTSRHLREQAKAGKRPEPPYYIL
jgi:hypothetical protein